MTDLFLDILIWFGPILIIILFIFYHFYYIPSRKIQGLDEISFLDIFFEIIKFLIYFLYESVIYVFDLFKKINAWINRMKQNRIEEKRWTEKIKQEQEDNKKQEEWKQEQEAKRNKIIEEAIIMLRDVQIPAIYNYATVWNQFLLRNIEINHIDTFENYRENDNIDINDWAELRFNENSIYTNVLNEDIEKIVQFI